MLNDVRRFLDGRRSASVGGKPRLYCSSKWWQQKQPGDPVQDENGQPIPDESIRDRFGNQLGVVEDKQQYAYWTDEYKAYTIGDNSDGEFNCDNEDNLAVTDDSKDIRLNELQPRTLTFFHEVMHIVRGVEATTRVIKKPSE